MRRLTAVDLFSGAGGATEGLRDAGFEVLGAVENDRAAAASYALNHPDVYLWSKDIRSLTAASMARTLNLAPGELSLLKACPPCQGFSSLAEGRATVDEKQNDLVINTIRFVRVLRPEAVMLENVPGLGRDQRAQFLVDALEKLGYVARQYRVNAISFGVPQRRKRLIILALRGRRRNLPTDISPGIEERSPVTVRSAFDELANTMLESDPLNVSRKLQAKVAERVRAVPVGGTRFDLPENLRLDCHERLGSSRRTATASYGRIKSDEPGPTMTTRCTTVACGSFIHPTQDRGITLREAAVLQTFPVNYQFSGTYGEIERQIGNAVPVKMAAALGGVVLDLLRA